MRQPPLHALTQAVMRCLAPPHDPRTRRFLDLLDRRLAALASGRPIRVRAGERALAAGFLEPFMGRWDDGDENLVRGYLDGWAAPDEDAARAARARLLGAARALSAIQARPATLWFFLWEMESVLAGLEGGDPDSSG
jgi:hypothetical protein